MTPTTATAPTMIHMRLGPVAVFCAAGCSAAGSGWGSAAGAGAGWGSVVGAGAGCGSGAGVGAGWGSAAGSGCGSATGAWSGPDTFVGCGVAAAGDSSPFAKGAPHSEQNLALSSCCAPHLGQNTRPPLFVVHLVIFIVSGDTLIPTSFPSSSLTNPSTACHA